MISVKKVEALSIRDGLRRRSPRERRSSDSTLEERPRKSRNSGVRTIKPILKTPAQEEQQCRLDLYHAVTPSGSLRDPELAPTQVQAMARMERYLCRERRSMVDVAATTKHLTVSVSENLGNEDTDFVRVLQNWGVARPSPSPSPPVQEDAPLEASPQNYTPPLKRVAFRPGDQVEILPEVSPAEDQPSSSSLCAYSWAAPAHLFRGVRSRWSRILTQTPPRDSPGQVRPW